MARKPNSINYETRADYDAQNKSQYDWLFLVYASVIVIYMTLMTIAIISSNKIPQTFPAHLVDEMNKLGWEHFDGSFSKHGVIVVYNDDTSGYYIYSKTTIPENLKEKITEDFKISLELAELKYEMKKN